ncbi:E3 ubiquitin-protein ligase SIAH1A-like isoform X2 [Harmonia axyridis]|uniref:E3 ubiquitin-protein ligase SIAH1A-like isoform X2 n=1 Tax=Harmonia axyridis TaxID=115357 RepID=UPI001E275A4A|nr:E3 ubiquitin-protein ligase SIAH1A-like isoform X2 [Harmonia axyridis]
MSSPKKQPCPICRKGLKNPTSQCASGHKVCNDCLTTPSTLCPICNAWITKITPPTVKCKYSNRSCKYVMTEEESYIHEMECRFRDFICEGHRFGCWNCPWAGRYDQIQDHYKKDHEDSTGMLFKTEAMLKIDLKENFRSISLIDFHEGQNFFWFKCRVDKKRKMFYSTVQLIGTRKLAGKYCYEFEIFKGPVRKIKVTEICDSDAMDAERIFDNENCVAISFETLKNYLDENGVMRFRFRIMSIKKN